MKINAKRIVIFFALIALSIGFGFGFDAVATLIEKKTHPRPESLRASVTENANRFGIPETVLWACMCERSDFQSNAVSKDGKIGLMQLTEEQFTQAYEIVLQKEVPDKGLLYDPLTNLSCGAAYLSLLYQRYTHPMAVFAALYAGTDAVDTWLTDRDNISDAGVLIRIPDKDCADFVHAMEKSVALYQRLYYPSK